MVLWLNQPFEVRLSSSWQTAFLVKVEVWDLPLKIFHDRFPPKVARLRFKLMTPGSEVRQTASCTMEPGYYGDCTASNGWDETVHYDNLGSVAVGRTTDIAGILVSPSVCQCMFLWYVIIGILKTQPTVKKYFRLYVCDLFICLQVWSTSTCEFVRTLNGHKRGIACLQYRDRLVVSGSSDNTIRWVPNKVPVRYWVEDVMFTWNTQISKSSHESKIWYHLDMTSLLISI